MPTPVGPKSLPIAEFRERPAPESGDRKYAARDRPSKKLQPGPGSRPDSAAEAIARPIRTSQIPAHKLLSVARLVGAARGAPAAASADPTYIQRPGARSCAR